ncbi:hypothetical protein ABH920_007714 [Catenulispora sp. EB89]|uniref:hypothetical protein n=1 Tax=Catenulispora sp. EB89 TaxID=3156257 RepID=UPI003518C81C
MSQRVRARAAASLAVLAVTGGGVSALTTAAHAATASGSGTTANGPIAYNDGVDWSEVNADGTGSHTVVPTGGGFTAADGPSPATRWPRRRAARCC